MRFLTFNPDPLLRRLAPWGVVLAVLWAGLWSAQSYVTAQDPSTIYLPLARKIADSNFSLESVREVAHWMAPGWPLLLAMAIKMGGPFAPAWIQLPFALLALIALWRIIARHTDSVAVAWLAVGLTLLAWLAGPGPTFACLLYPFRELPAFACALWAVERAGEGNRRNCALLGGLLILAAGGLRETFVPCAAAGAVAAVWLAPCDRRTRALRTGLVLAPMLLALPTLALLFPDAVNRQVYNVWSNLAAGMLPAPLPEAAAGLLGMMARQVTWAGLLLPLLALARRQTRGPGALLLGMTAAQFAVHLLLPPHFRYGLGCSLLMPAGVAVALTPVVLSLTRRSGFAVAGVGLAGLFALALSQDSWGPPVGRAEVAETLRRVAASLPPGRPFYAEHRSRRLASCLIGFSSSWPQGDPDRPLAGGLYFEVLAELEREDRAERAMPSPRVDARLRSRGMELVPVRNREGRTIPLHFAGSSFKMERVTPHPQTPDPPPGR